MAVEYDVDEEYIISGGPKRRTAKLRGAITTSAIRDDPAIARAVERAGTKQFERGLKRLGLTEEQIALAMGAQEFKADNLLSTVDMAGAFVDREIIEIMTEIGRLTKLINDPETPPATVAKHSISRSFLRRDLASFVKINQAGLLTAARVRKIWHEIEGDKKKKKEPKAVLDLSDPDE